MSDQTTILVRAAFLILGFSQTTTWNGFLNSYIFFMTKFADDPETWDPSHPKNGYQEFWTSAFGFAINFVQLAAMIGNVILSMRYPAKYRIYPALTIMMLCVFSVAGLTFMDTRDAQGLFFTILLVLANLCEIGSGISVSGLTGVASAISPRTTATFVMGAGLCGMVYSVLALISSLAFEDSHHSTLMFFCVTGGICAVNILCYVFVSKKVGNYNKQLEIKPYISASRILSELWSDIKYVWQYLKYQAIALLLCSSISLTFYPVIPQLAQSNCVDNGSESWFCENIGRSETYYIQIFCFIWFNLFDFLGRVLADNFQIIKPTNGKALLACSLSRFGIGCLYFLIRRTDFAGISFFGDDWFYILLNAVFGASHGYFSTLCFIFASKLTEDGKKERVGAVMPMFLAFGLVLGSSISFATVAVIR